MSTDLAPIFNEELKKHNAAPLINHSLNLQSIDEFLKEAYRINSHLTSLNTYLLSIRKPYLSTTPATRRLRPADDKTKHLTDRQRDEIDADTKLLLRDLNSSIRNLADAEQIRQNTKEAIARKKYGHNKSRFANALSSWAAGDDGVSGKGVEELEDEAREKNFAMFREGVLWFLRQKLQSCGQKQAEMMEVRITREMDKNKSVLSKARGDVISDFGLGPEGFAPSSAKSKVAAKTALMESQRLEGGRGNVPELSEEQLQMFEQENQDMLKHYEQTLDQVRTAEKSLVEISELQTQLVSNLETQSAHIEQLVADSSLTTENIGGGNKQLKKATERESTAKWVFYGSCGLCTVLVLWDLVI